MTVFGGSSQFQSNKAMKFALRNQYFFSIIKWRIVIILKLHHCFNSFTLSPVKEHGECRLAPAKIIDGANTEGVLDVWVKSLDLRGQPGYVRGPLYPLKRVFVTTLANWEKLWIES